MYKMIFWLVPYSRHSFHTKLSFWDVQRLIFMTEISCSHEWKLLILFVGHFDHGLRWAVQEDELVKQLLFHLHLSSLSHNKDVIAQFEHAIHTRQLLIHDGSRYAREELPHKLTNDQHHGHVQTHNAAAPEKRKQEDRFDISSVYSKIYFIGLVHQKKMKIVPFTLHVISNQIW